MKALLHIGLEKTGTTSIQSALYEHFRELRRIGVYVPVSMGKRHDAILMYSAPKIRLSDLLAGKKIDDAELYELNEGFAGVLREVRAEAEKDCDLVVFSHECLSSRVRSLGEIEQLHAVLNGVFDDVEVLVYLRDQYEYLLSLYTEAVKADTWTDFDRWVDDFDYMELDYYSFISNWRRVFGEENVTVRVFDKQRLLGGDVVRDFLSVIGADEFFDWAPVRRNTSIGERAVELCKLINKIFPLYLPGGRRSFANRMLKKIVRALPEKKPFSLSVNYSHLRKEISEKYSDSNVMVEKEFL